MFQRLKKANLAFGAAMIAGSMAGSNSAFAAGGNDWTNISNNMIGSIEGLPGLLTGLAYMFGILLSVLGVLKIKDHVENPSNAPLKDGAIRLAAGGALFSVPIITEAMTTTIGDGTAVEVPQLNAVSGNTL